MTRPRIHWVSPLPPASTEIAQYTRRLLLSLTEWADVTLWTDAETWDPRLEELTEVRRYDADRPNPLGSAVHSPGGEHPEAIFIHIGNNIDHHSGPFRLARKVDSCLILHDTAILHFLNELVAHGQFRATQYIAVAYRWYGPGGAAAIHKGLAGEGLDPIAFAAYPMWEAAVGRATAILTHTPEAYAAISARGIARAYRLELPHAFGPARSRDVLPEGPLRLVQFGHMSDNRRLEPVLRALSAYQERSVRPDFALDVFGQTHGMDGVSALVDALALGERVTFHGFVPEEQLDDAIRHADLVFNLRNPTMGEASASQLKIWENAAASVVTGHGWYASLPDDAVFKIRPDDEAEAIPTLLDRLADDRALSVRMGAAGRRHLEAHHTVAAYSDGIKDIIGWRG